MKHSPAPRNRYTSKRPLLLAAAVALAARLAGTLALDRRRAIGLLVILAALGPGAQAQLSPAAPFTRITNSVIGAEAAQSVAGAWGDYDNDGWLDLFVGNHRASENWLFHNNRDGTFHKVESDPLTTDAPATPWGAAWADYDNDGWLDLIVTSHDGFTPSRLYRNRGDGSFVRPSLEEAGSLAEDASRTHSVSWVDYDNDGRLDLFMANGMVGQGMEDFLYHNEGNGRFERVTDSPITTATKVSMSAGWSDYDSDGDMDLFVTHTGGVGNSLFRNDRQGRFVEATFSSGLGDNGESGGLAWGDPDNNGQLDLFVANIQITGPVTSNFYYRYWGAGAFERMTTGILATDRDHFVSPSWVDYDNDGWLDLFVTVLGVNSSKPRNRLYRNQGDGTFVSIEQGRLVTDSGNFGSTAWGDYDNDGFPDVFVTFGTIYSAQRSALYRNDGNRNSWIKVRCVGTTSNRSAIGARIRVKARIGGADRWQMRQIVGTEGWVSFNSLDALIGLGDASVIETLRVEWPSGLVQEFHDVEVKQTLVLVEHTGFSIVHSGTDEVEMTVRGPRQQRYRVESSIDLRAWSPAASLTISNPDGTASLRHRLGMPGTGLYFRAVAE